VGVTTQGQAVTILGSTLGGQWLAVRPESGRTAWIASFLVPDAPQTDLLPIVNGSGDVVATPGPLPSATARPATRSPSSQVPVIQVPATQIPTTQRLTVEFLNPHYNCNRQGEAHFYRYFQIDFFVTNTTGQTIPAPWEPSRWLIVGGDSPRSDTAMNQWCDPVEGCYPQPDIAPGERAGWTFIAPFVELWEWVEAVEWRYDGQLYRQTFENTLANQTEWNYLRCPE
jgi:hypothetical protein